MRILWKFLEYTKDLIAQGTGCQGSGEKHWTSACLWRVCSGELM